MQTHPPPKRLLTIWVPAPRFVGDLSVWITRRVASSSLRTGYPWCLSHHPLALLVQPLAHCQSRLLPEASATYSSILEVQLSCSLPDVMDVGGSISGSVGLALIRRDCTMGGSVFIIRWRSHRRMQEIVFTAAARPCTLRTQALARLVWC